MRVPDVELEVRAECKIYPSEDPAKVLRAVKNVLSDCEPRVLDNTVVGMSRDASSLRTIYQQVRSRQTMGVIKRMLLGNMLANSTWFYLNKQAAYGGTVSICEEESESPLGPIKVMIRSGKLDSVINWLVPI